MCSDNQGFTVITKYKGTKGNNYNQTRNISKNNSKGPILKTQNTVHFGYKGHSNQLNICKKIQWKQSEPKGHLK